MKREILFRAKRTTFNEWVFGDLINYSESEIKIIDQNCRCWDILEGGYDVIPETVGQFTGLLDKNGEKIFEGDIVKYYQPFANRTDIHIVLYDDLFASFCLFEKDNKWAKESDWMKIQDVEVIGDIYDNPYK